MAISQSEFKTMLRRLRDERVELATVDGKSNLALDTEGDKAYFIRHAAALANNIQPSYIIIGVEDNTWNPIGLGEDSTLRNVDETQHRLNQILKNKLDPNLWVQYGLYEVDKVTYGLISLEGKRAPYVIAIDSLEYGGPRTKGKPEYIHRGVVYIRHGANSIIANRQSEITGIIDRVAASENETNPFEEFLETHNYIF